MGKILTILGEISIRLLSCPSFLRWRAARRPGNRDNTRRSPRHAVRNFDHKARAALGLQHGVADGSDPERFLRHRSWLGQACAHRPCAVRSSGGVAICLLAGASGLQTCTWQVEVSVSTRMACWKSKLYASFAAVGGGCNQVIWPPRLNCDNDCDKKSRVEGRSSVLCWIALQGMRRTSDRPQAQMPGRREPAATPRPGRCWSSCAIWLKTVSLESKVTRSRRQEVAASRGRSVGKQSVAPGSRVGVVPGWQLPQARWCE